MAKSTNKSLYLVDVSSMFFRAFYAIRPLSSPSGLPTNAIYGFLSMVTKLMKQDQPDLLVFCYDRKEPSFRRDLYVEYKAHRSEMPEDLVPQIPYIKKFATALGVPAFEVESFEADDLIGTMAVWGEKQGYNVSIVSGDKDFAQLVSPQVSLYDTMKEIKYDPAGVVAKWGIKPEQMIDYLALVGDTSDNIPGVKGIGPKGALKLLADFQNLDGVYANIDKIKGSTQEKLREHKDMAYLSQKLVTIVTDVPMSTDPAIYQLQPPDTEALRSLLQEVNFKNMEKTLLQDWPFRSEKRGEIAPTAVAMKAETQTESVEQSAAKTAPAPGSVASGSANSALPASPFMLLEVSAKYLRDNLKSGEALWGLALPQALLFFSEARKQIFVALGEANTYGPALAGKKLQWSGYDLKSFWHKIELPLTERPQVVWDGMLAAYLLKSGEKMDFERVYGHYVSSTPAEMLTVAQIVQQHQDLRQALIPPLKEIHGESLLTTMEHPLIALLWEIETRGVRLDTGALEVQSKELSEELAHNEQDIEKLAGEKFNIASPKQLAHILFEKLQLPPGRKTKTGFSTDNEVLEELRDKHPIAAQVLVYRELSKLKSTYVDALPTMVRADGRLHTTFNQAATATGRLSSTDPNLQNIPIRTPRGARVRQAFIAAPGKSLLSVDYSQIELRILAHYSGDVNMTKAFFDNLDIHAATASEVFDVKLSEVTDNMRRTAKAVNFGIAYGQGAFGLAEVLGISRSESTEIISKYFTRFPGIRAYIDNTIEEAKKNGFVETLYGRRRYMDELKSAAPAMRKFGERAAINAPIQGTASDIVKLAMVKVSEQVQLPMILQVHDELIFEGTEAEIEAEQKQIIGIMESVIQMKVPLRANAAVGKNWDEAH